MTKPDVLASMAPFSTLPQERLERLRQDARKRAYGRGTTIISKGEKVAELVIIVSGQVETSSGGGNASMVGPGETLGARAIVGSQVSRITAIAKEDTEALVLNAGSFRALLEENTAFAGYFSPAPARPATRSLAETRVQELMAAHPVTVSANTPIIDAARLLRERKISSVLVTDEDHLVGIVTVRDISGRVVAEGLEPARPVRDVMTAAPVTLPPDAIGSDVLHTMMEEGIGHVPIVGTNGLVGIVSQTDLTRFQAETTANLIREVASAANVSDLAVATAQIPQLLGKLVAAGHRHEVITRLITDIADAVTRRLLTFAEAELGNPPVPYLWLACGSQGRREQTGTSDQDNCLFLHDDTIEEHDEYFATLAQIVSDGLDACGYVHCPGEMMATNPRWRQPVSAWRRYFKGWIEKPDPMAQMLASVMFDLRPIGGDHSLHEGLHLETLEAASQNSIFVAHMVSNALKHKPPLGLFGGLAGIRSGPHRNTLDMKLKGVVPIVDLARVYALRGELSPVNTRARIEAAEAAGTVSKTGGQDLLDAYDLIAQTRLEHQAAQVREGQRPDNFMPPTRLSTFERGHLKSAFQVVQGMQSAATQGQGIL